MGHEVPELDKLHVRQYVNCNIARRAIFCRCVAIKTQLLVVSSDDVLVEFEMAYFLTSRHGSLSSAGDGRIDRPLGHDTPRIPLTLYPIRLVHHFERVVSRVFRSSGSALLGSSSVNSANKIGHSWIAYFPENEVGKHMGTG